MSSSTASITGEQIQRHRRVFSPEALRRAALRTRSVDGKPITAARINGYIAEFAYWPAQNIDVNVTTRVFGNSTVQPATMTGAESECTDNNTVFVGFGWF